MGVIGLPHLLGFNKRTLVMSKSISTYYSIAMAQENTKIIKENMNSKYMIRTSIVMAKGEENETI